MNSYLFDQLTYKARKHHRCIYCYHLIEKGESYIMQIVAYDGTVQKNKYHQECLDDLIESGDEDFTPGAGDPPERLRKKHERTS